ncbi:MAG: ester cyclase [Candidatus Aminicenantes bacterium]|nr:MAG: ester cyclase [Candidatus Aminicenantes bacterium]
MKKSLTQLFLVISLCFLLCFSISCQNQEAMAELEAMKAQVEVEEQNKALVNRMYEAFSTGDFEAYKEMVAPEYVWYFPSRSTKPVSREETIEFVKMLRNAFPDIAYSIEELIAVEDRVISRFIVRGTHEGEYQGIPATGNKIEVSGIVMTRIENGKIVEDKEELDALGLMM